MTKLALSLLLSISFVGCSSFNTLRLEDRPLARRIAPAYDANNFMTPIVVTVMPGGGIERAEQWVDAIYVTFYYDGIAPSEWDQMQLFSAIQQCGWAMRFIPHITEDQERACGWALLEMRYKELAPVPGDGPR